MNRIENSCVLTIAAAVLAWAGFIWAAVTIGWSIPYVVVPAVFGFAALTLTAKSVRIRRDHR